MSGSGGTTAFAKRLFERHGTAIYRYFHRLTGDRAAAEDLAQEVFVRVVGAADTYQDRDTERAWVFRIARNLLVDSQRQQWRNRSATVRLDAVAPANQATRVSLREGLSRIPADEREAFLLRELGGLSYSEIAATTDSTVPAVRSRIYRARLALRDLLNPPAPLVSGVVRRHDHHDLWLVQQDADGELVTDRYQVTARQGQQVDYFFRPVPYGSDGRRTSSDPAVLMNVSGAIRGRLRTDGNIDLSVDGARGFMNSGSTAWVGVQGRTLLTVKPGETVEVTNDLPVGGNLSGFGDLKQAFGRNRTAVRITARRLW